MIGRNDHAAKYAEDFRTHFQKVIQYKGKARAHTASVFQEQVLDAGGVNFSVKFKQVSYLFVMKKSCQKNLHQRLCLNMVQKKTLQP